jgi:hypothetical protein
MRIPRLFVTRADALASGLTHEGSIYGVPSWMRVDGDDYMAAAKFAPLAIWCVLCDKVFDIWAAFMSDEYILVSPMKLGKRID